MKTIHDIPKDLPNAYIYLDDLEQIESIATTALRNSGRAESCHFEYEIPQGNRTTLRFSSIEELKQHKGKTDRFNLEMIVEGRPIGETILRINGRFSTPSFRTFYMMADEFKWSAFSQVERIFKARQLKWRNLAATLPLTELWVLCGGIFLIPCITHIVHARTPLPYWPFTIPWALIAILVGFAMTTTSRVILSYSRPDENERQAQRKDFIKQFAVLALAAIAGVIVGAILTHHFGTQPCVPK